MSVGRKYTRLEVEMADAINNLALALDSLTDNEHRKVEKERSLAVKILDRNNMLSEHPDWQNRIIVNLPNSE
jgi:hypothetical protein